MQTSKGFQLHNADAHCRRNSFLDDRNPIGRSNGKYTRLTNFFIKYDTFECTKP